jgi:hypothetical protein
MKKPRTEMTNERAKLLLSAYRHNGADAQDPFFHEALEQATRDPEVASWLTKQRGFDALIVEKLSSIQPPPSLQSAILDSIRSGPSKNRLPFRSILAMAAILVLSGVLLSLMFRQSDPDSRSLAQYQNAALAVLAGGIPRLDLMTPDFSRAQEYLLERAAPRAPAIPASLQELQTAGCRAIDWNGKMVSLTCFRLPSGELLHLFVIDAKSLNELALRPGIQEINGWHVECRRVKGMLLMFVSKAPMSELTRYI